MGDAVRMCMSRSMHAGSPRRDNAEEVAKRRAAMQRELEQRREEARRLQEEKMARAAAQKEERLQKQRELQQKEVCRMQAAQKRRCDALAEEKRRKSAAIAKVEQAASRAQAQQKARPVYAFGSSTPRELGYLVQLSKQQQVYDRKLQPASGGVSSPALNSSRRLSSTARESQMTRSMYLPGTEASKRINNRPVSTAMTRSVLTPQQLTRGSPKPQHTPRQTPIREIIARRSNASSPAQRMGIKRVPKTSTPKTPDAKPPTMDGKEKNVEVSGRPKAIKGGNKQNGVEHLVVKEEVVVAAIPDSVAQNIGSDDKRGDMEHIEKEVVAAVSDSIAKDMDEHLQPVTSSIEVDKAEDSDMDLKHDAVEQIVTEEEVSGTELDDKHGAVEQMVIEKEVAVEAASVSIMEASEEHLKSIADELDMAKDGDVDQKHNAVGQMDIEKEVTVEVEPVLIVEASEENPKSIADELEKVENSDAGLMDDAVERVAIEEEVVMEALSDSIVEASDEHPKSTTDELDMAKDGDVDQKRDSVEQMLAEEKVAAIKPDDEQLWRKSTRWSSELDKSEVSIEDVAAAAPEAIAKAADEHPEPMTLPDKEKLSMSGLAEQLKEVRLEDAEEREGSKYQEAQREREERKARLAAIMSRTRGAPTAVVNPTTQNVAKESEVIKDLKENGTGETQRFAAAKTASILQKLASSNPQLISSNPHLMSLLQRNGSNPSLAEELSAADRKSPSFAQSSESLNVSNNVTIRPFEGDAETQRTVAMI